MAAPIGNQYALGGNGGRPNKYEDHTKEEWVALINEYINQCVDKEEPLTDQNGNVRSYIVRPNIPMVEGLSSFLGLHKDTIYDWAKKYQEFSDAICEVKRKQLERLVNSGLGGQYASSVVNRVLAANHGMADKSETDITSKGQQILSWQK